MPCVVADTSPLSYLMQLGRHELLRELYGRVHVPEQVWLETLAGAEFFPHLKPALKTAESADWIQIHSVPETAFLPEAAGLDSGEQAAIALVRLLGADLLIIDELDGRMLAARIGLKVTGTLAVLAEAKKAGLIPSLRIEFRRLREDTTFRFSRRLEQQILALAGEEEPP